MNTPETDRAQMDFISEWVRKRDEKRKRKEAKKFRKLEMKLLKQAIIHFGYPVYAKYERIGEPMTYPNVEHPNCRCWVAGCDERTADDLEMVDLDED